MKTKLLTMLSLSLGLMQAPVAEAQSSPLKCSLNFNSVNELSTWRLTDAKGNTRSEINFGSKGECSPSAQAVNGDYFCSIVITNPGFKYVIASLSTNKVVAALPITPDTEKRRCVDHLAKQKIKDGYLCVGTLNDWKVMNLKNSRLISVPFPSLEDCTEAIDHGGILSAGIPSEEILPEFVGRPISNKKYWIAQMVNRPVDKYQVGDEEFEVYLGSPEGCAVDVQGAWCPNPKVTLPKGAIIRAVGARMKFLIKPSFMYRNFNEAYIDHVNFDSWIEHKGIKYGDGFVLHRKGMK